MFTGIVEEMGVVTELNPEDETGGTSLTISLAPGSTLLDDCHVGDSISINGTCLTVTRFEKAPQPHFAVGVAPETLRLTNLGTLAAGSRVNLERAVRADTRMGGHFVQGHVDTIATIADMRPDGNALTVRFAPLDRSVLRYIVFKGYVALDGTSLTVTKVDDEQGWWEVMLIAYTQQKVILATKKVGDTVNVEVDMTAKYIDKGLQAYLEGLSTRTGLDQIAESIVAKSFGAK